MEGRPSNDGADNNIQSPLQNQFYQSGQPTILSDEKRVAEQQITISTPIEESSHNNDKSLVPLTNCKYISKMCASMEHVFKFSYSRKIQFQNSMNQNDQTVPSIDDANICEVYDSPEMLKSGSLYHDSTGRFIISQQCHVSVLKESYLSNVNQQLQYQKNPLETLDSSQDPQVENELYSSQQFIMDNIMASPTVKDIALYNHEMNQGNDYGKNIMMIDDFKIETQIEKKLVLSPLSQIVVETISQSILPFDYQSFTIEEFQNLVNYGQHEIMTLYNLRVYDIGGKTLMKIQQKELSKLNLNLTANFNQNNQQLLVSNSDYLSYPLQIKESLMDSNLNDDQVSQVLSRETQNNNNMYDMKFTPKTTFPDSFINPQTLYSMPYYSFIDQVPLLSQIYHSTSFLILTIIVVIVLSAGFVLKKYKDLMKDYSSLQEAHLKLALKNQELEFQNCKSQMTNSFQGEYLCLTYEQQQSQHSQSSEFEFNNGEQNCYSEESNSNSESSTDTAQDQFQIINESSSINFSPESKRSRISPIKNGLTPQLNYASKDNESKRRMSRIQLSTCSPYNPHHMSSPIILAKTLSFERTCKNQSHQHQHEQQKNKFGMQCIACTRKESSSHILIEDQEDELRSIGEDSKMRCQRNLFPPQAKSKSYVQSNLFQTLKLNQIQDQSQPQTFQDSIQNVTFKKQNEIDNDPYGMMTQTYQNNRQLLSDRTHQQKHRQASLQKKDNQVHAFRLPQPQRKLTSIQRPQTNSVGRQTFNSRSLFSPTLQFQVPSQNTLNLKNQGCYKLPVNPSFSPYVKSNLSQTLKQRANQDVSPKISFLKQENPSLYIAQKSSGKNLGYDNLQGNQYFDLTNIDQDCQYKDFHSARSYENEEFHEFPEEEQEIQEEQSDQDQQFEMEEEEEQAEYCYTSNQPNGDSCYHCSEEYEDQAEGKNYVIIKQTPNQIKSPALLPMVHEFEQFINLKHKTSASPIIAKLPFKDDISEESDKENFPSLVYLENGRYKNSFEEICFLGRGGFGVAHKVRHKLDSNFYAIKKIRIHLGYNQDIKEHRVYREIMALPQLNHKNVVRYFGCWAERIKQEDEQRISERVKKIQARISKVRQSIKGQIKEQKREYKVSKFEEEKPNKDRKKKEENELVRLNEFDLEAELDDAFENKSTYSKMDSSKSNLDKENYSNNENESQSESQSNSDNESVDSYSSYDDESQDENEEKEESEEEIDLVSPSLYPDDDDEDENSNMEKFDDDALIEFIKKDQKFMSIDLMIQMEFCSGSTLQEYLEEPNRIINRLDNFTFFKQLLQAVKHIHQNGFIHRDLKPPNIFLEGNALKVGDFGLARRVNGQAPNIQKIQNALTSNQKISPKALQKMSSIGIQKLVRSINQQSLLTTQVGTSTYLSPEQETNKAYNEKVDIFALGLILCEMYCKFSTLHERITTLNDLKYSAKLPQVMLDKYPIECEIIKMMTNKDPELRPSTVDLLKSPLLEKWSKLFSETLISPREPQLTNPQDQNLQNVVIPQDQSPLSSKEQEAHNTTSNNIIKAPTLINEIGLSLFASQSSLLFRDEITAELEHMNEIKS